MNNSYSRRRFITRTLPAALASGLPFGAIAQQPLPEILRITNGYPAGGPVDMVCRKLAERLGGKLARNVIVENKPGAAGRLAIEALKGSPADGSVLVITPGSVVTMYPHIYKNLSYDVFADLAPVGIVATFSFALVVGPAVPDSVRSVTDFVSWCKANPALAQCGNAGAGSFPHFMALLFGRDAGLDLTHVSYRGGALAMQAAAGGQISSALSTESSALSLAQAGRLRVLATTGNERSSNLPQVPTFREQGYANLAQSEWFAAFMPAKTASPVIDAASGSLSAVLREPEVREIWQKNALSAVSSTPGELRKALRTEHDFWGPIVRASGFTPEA